MDQFPLLNLEDEIDLTRKLEDGRNSVRTILKTIFVPTEEVELEFAKGRGRFDPRSWKSVIKMITENSNSAKNRDNDKVQTLRDAYSNYLDVRNKIINHNYRLVYALANKMLTSLRARGRTDLEFVDLFSAGAKGLIRSVEKYENRDPRIKVRTYAAYWIKEALHRAVEKFQRTISLNTNLGHNDDETFTFNAVLEDDDSSDLEVDRSDYIRSLLDKLNPRERKILSMVYGLDGDPPQNFAIIGRSLNLSRERVRQIHNRAIRKIKNFPEIQNAIA